MFFRRDLHRKSHNVCQIAASVAKSASRSQLNNERRRWAPIADLFRTKGIVISRRGQISRSVFLFYHESARLRLAQKPSSVQLEDSDLCFLKAAVLCLLKQSNLHIGAD